MFVVVYQIVFATKYPRVLKGEREADKERKCDQPPSMNTNDEPRPGVRNTATVALLPAYLWLLGQP